MVDRIPAPFVMFDCLLTLGGADDYAASVNKAQIDPTTTQGIWKGLTPTARIPVSGGTDWVLSLTGAQDWETDDSLSNYMFEHAGETVPYRLEPVKGGTAFTGTFIAAPGTVGGTLGTDATTQDYTLNSSFPVKVPAV